MSDRFETIDLNAAEEQLSIEIRPGRTWEGMDYEPGTDFRIVPPLTEEEHIALLEAHGPDSKIGETLGGGVHKEGEWLDVNSEGEPGPEQVEHAVELAQAIITLKGLKAAKVVNTVGEVTHS